MGPKIPTLPPPIVTSENTTGIYEVGLDANGKCNQLRLVSGGPTKVGSNGGPHPGFGDFGSNIDGLSFHNGFLYANDFTGGPEGAHSGPVFSGGRLHRVDPVTGERVALIANLPSEGDHQNDGIVFFSDKGQDWIEFEQGTTTNSGTVDGEGQGDIPLLRRQVDFGWGAVFPVRHGLQANREELAGW